MSDQAVKFSAQVQPAGTPVQNTTIPAGNEQNNQVAAPETRSETPADKPLTAAELRAIVQEETVRAFEGLRRRQQSETAKLENRIKGMVQDQIATLQAAGVQVDDKGRQAIENVIRQKAGEQPSETVAQPPAGQQAASSETETTDPVDAAAFAMMEAAGVMLEDTDPEAQNLDRTSQKAYLASLAKAIQAKQARVSTSPGARMPAGGGTPARGYSDDGLSGVEGLDLYFRNKK